MSDLTQKENVTLESQMSKLKTLDDIMRDQKLSTAGLGCGNLLNNSNQDCRELL